MDGRKDGPSDPRVGAGGLWLQALRSVFVSAPLPAPPRWGEGRGKGRGEARLQPPPGPSLLLGTQGILQRMQRESRALPAAMRWPPQQKRFCT